MNGALTALSVADRHPAVITFGTAVVRLMLISFSSYTQLLVLVLAILLTSEAPVTNDDSVRCKGPSRSDAEAP